MEQNPQRSFKINMKKIESINVKNFQIWKDVDLKLGDFNVIKGSSNSGKSSLVRAINMVLNNDWHKSWLRQDEIDTSVEIHFTDGTSIKRIRGSQNSVKITPSDTLEESMKWSGFGNTYPDEVKNFLSISEENCSYQFDQHFFLSLSPSKRALTFGSFSDLQKIDEINNLVQKKIRDGEKLLKSYELELERLEKDLEKSNSFLELKPAVQLLLKINDFKKTLYNVVNYKNRINSIDKMLHSFTPMEEVNEYYREYETLLMALEINHINDEILLMDNDIEDLNNQLQEEEMCPTCGQQIGEKHEKTT